MTQGLVFPVVRLQPPRCGGPAVEVPSPPTCRSTNDGMEVSAAPNKVYRPITGNLCIGMVTGRGALRFSCAVLAGVNLARKDVEGNAGKGFEGAEGLGDVTHLQNRICRLGHAFQLVSSGVNCWPSLSFCPAFGLHSRATANRIWTYCRSVSREVNT